MTDEMMELYKERVHASNFTDRMLDQIDRLVRRMTIHNVDEIRRRMDALEAAITENLAHTSALNSRLTKMIVEHGHVVVDEDSDGNITFVATYPGENLTHLVT